MLGVTLGVGPQWESLARLAAAQMHYLTGLDCRVIRQTIKPVVHPSWAKSELFEHFPREQELFYFDADILCLKHWWPENIFEATGRAFTCVLDRNNPAVLDECKLAKLPFPDGYFNAGLFITATNHQPLFDRMMTRYPSYGKWLEQTAMNKAAAELKQEKTLLPRIFNTLADYPRLTPEQANADGVINAHCCSCSTTEHVLAMWRPFVESGLFDICPEIKAALSVHDTVLN